MPYVRCGKCVYKGKKCKTKGEKVGCSDSIEKAEKYLTKLRMETNENIMKITKNELIQLIKEELEVILTDDEVKEMFGIDVSEYSELSETEVLSERVETQKQTPIERGSAAMLNDHRARIESLENIMRRDSETFRIINERLDALEQK